MLASCTKLKPIVDDGLPRGICKDCSRQLKKVYAFNLQCEKSDVELRNVISQNGIELNSIPNHDIKQEYNELKRESDSLDDTKPSCVSDEDGIKNDIKTENDEDNESNWDAEDDNLVLEEIKSKKDDGANLDHGDTPDIWLEKDINKRPKAKRGRKKKENNGLSATPISKMPHQCDVCGKILSTKSNLKAHKICHTDVRPYKCTECPATFRGHSALFQHKKVHTKETPYHCEYCPKQFSRRTGLVNHIRVHTGEKLYSCGICFKNFVQSAQLSIHVKRHMGDKPFLCQDCGKGFPIKSDLRVHQRIHNGEKPYSCHLCTKTFATSGNLAIHIRIHNKEVRYNCPVCQRGFVTCSAYNVHLKRHKGQKDYHCECGKTFYTSSALKQHRVVHTGEKKYQCKICERKFTQTSHLTRHFKRDHAKPGAPIPSSNQYKVILNENKSHLFVYDQNLAGNNADVKCEGP